MGDAQPEELEQQGEEDAVASPPETLEDALAYLASADPRDALFLAAGLKARPKMATEVDATGDTLLHHAAALGDLDVVAAVLACPRCKPGARNERGENAGHVAQALSHTSCVDAIYAAIGEARPNEAWIF